MKPILLSILILAAVTWFARNVYRLIRLVGQGLPENRLGKWDKRILNVVEQVFLHRRLLNRPGPGVAHLLFFYGFLVIQVCAIEIFANGFYSKFSYSFLGPFYPAIMFMQDLMCFGVFVAIAYASYRRTVIKPKHLMLTNDAWTILGLILGVVSTIYLLGASDIALGNRKGVEWAMPIEMALSGFITDWPKGVLEFIREAAWWAHVCIVLGFLNYLPYSKHLHLLGAIPNIFFAKTERRAALPTPNLEAEGLEVFGASEPAHFTWKHLLDTTACTECGRCTSVCPANATGKPLSPMKIVHDLKLALFDTAPKVLAVSADPEKQNVLNRIDASFEKLTKDFQNFMKGEPKGNGQTATAEAEVQPLIGGRTSLDELWSCTTCGGCVNACPVLIEHVDDIVDMRRNLVLMQSSFPEELQRTFTALENEGNPWGVSSASRADWTKGTDVKILSEGETTPLLYWVGCAGAVDSRAKKVTQAMIKILKAAGIEFAVLGTRETCTGDPARRVGNEYLYQTLAKANVETLNGHKVTKIVTQCPHCFNTLGNEYPDLGGKYEVVHHSQLIQELIEAGKIKPSQAPDGDLVTFHDPCYLGRWNGVVEEPREIIEALPGAKTVEMERSKKNSFCCGAGGGRMWMEEHLGTPVNRERSREAVETGAKTVAVGCPFCMTMISDGVKDLGKEESVKVRDLAELVADSLK